MTENTREKAASCAGAGVPSNEQVGDAVCIEADVWTDYWTCDVPYDAMSGLPVPEDWWFIGRRCRAVNPIFYKVCRRCGFPQGWQDRKRGAA